MKKRVIGIVYLWIGVMMSGCIIPQPTFTEEEQQIKYPVDNITYYSEAFKKLDRLIAQTTHPTYRFQVKTIENMTSARDSLPIDSKSFIETPMILYMKSMQLMAYEPIFTRYETITTGHLYFPTMRKVMPQLVINGGVTQFDKGILSKSTNYDIDAEFGEAEGESDLRADRDRSNSISQIALDLNVFRYKDRVYVPGAATKNKIEISQIRKKNRFGFFLNGSGIGASKYSTLQQSKDEALRILTEYSLLQLLGRLYGVPYWSCISPEARPDDFIVGQKVDKFRAADNRNKQAYIEQLLPLYGYSGVTVDGDLSEAEQQMLVEIVEKYKFNTKKVFSPEFYQQLYQHIPAEKV